MASGQAGIAQALERRVGIMCGTPLDAVPVPRMDLLEVRAERGNLRLQIGQDSVQIPADDLLALDSARLTTTVRGGNAAMAAAIANGNLEFQPLRSDDACDVDDECVEWMIGRKGALGFEDLTAFADGMSFPQQRPFVPAPPATATTVRQEVNATTDAATNYITVRVRSGVADQSRWTFAPAGAAEVVSVRAVGYKPGDRVTWPGQDPEKPGADHGQFIAGVIGAQGKQSHSPNPGIRHSHH